MSAAVDRAEQAISEFERLLQRKQATKRRVEAIIADCESLFVVNPAGERVLEVLEQRYCQPPQPESLARMTGEDAKAAVARWQGATDVIRFLRAAARGALVVMEARRAPHAGQSSGDKDRRKGYGKSRRAQ